MSPGNSSSTVTQVPEFAAAYPNSRRVYVEQPFSGGPYGSITLKVPMREIRLSGGEPPLRVYNTSGPQGHDVREGLPPLRQDWILARGDVEPVERPHRPDGSRQAEMPPSLLRPTLRGRAAVTQLHYARAGVVTPEMAFVAAREGLDPQFVRSEIVRWGKVVQQAGIAGSE